MQLFQLRTWHRVCASAFLLFPVAMLGWMMPEHHLLHKITAPFFVLLLVLGILGAVQGILFAFKKLELGCPLCRKKSRVIDGNKQSIWLDCPDCGRLQISHGLIRLKVIRCKSARD